MGSSVHKDSIGRGEVEGRQEALLHAQNKSTGVNSDRWISRESDQTASRFEVVKMKAYVTSRAQATNFPVNGKGCHVLFQEPDYQYADGLPFGGWHDTIVIECHDITKPEDGYVHFSQEMAARLAEFLKKNEGRGFLVSCDAGLSRSVAAGAILRDYFGYNVMFESAGDDEFRNVLIYTRLARILR